jgi:hypothetical protein
MYVKLPRYNTDAHPPDGDERASYSPLLFTTTVRQCTDAHPPDGEERAMGLVLPSPLHLYSQTVYRCTSTERRGEGYDLSTPLSSSPLQSDSQTVYLTTKSDSAHVTSRAQTVYRYTTSMLPVTALSTVLTTGALNSSINLWSIDQLFISLERYILIK